MFARRGQVRLGDFDPKFHGLFLSYWAVKNPYPLYIGPNNIVLLKNFWLINHDQMHDTTT